MDKVQVPLAVLAEVVRARAPKPRPLLYRHDANSSCMSKNTPEILYHSRYNSGTKIEID